jgi:hypothetical protein
MAHVLATLRGVKFEDVKNMLRTESSKHAEQGMYLKHIWKNMDDSSEVLFIFQTNDLEHARKYIEAVHTQALKENPQVNLPQMIFLNDK